MSIRVYHVSGLDLGKSVKMYPRIPYSASIIEDENTERICCAPTIVQCIISSEIYCTLDKDTRRSRDIYVYSTNISNPSDIIMPTDEQCCDAYYTGEMWITKPKIFKLYGVYNLAIQKELHYPYSKFSCTLKGEEEYKINSKDIVNGNNKSFVFMAIDYARIRSRMMNQNPINNKANGILL